MNCKLDVDAWTQTTIYVNEGGLGLRNVTNLSLSSFLASTHSVADLLQAILPSHVVQSFDTFDTIRGFTNPNWDKVICTKYHQDIWDKCTSDIGKARLLANKTNESGAWLNAFPSSSLGTLLDDQTFRISIGLRLGTPLCHPHFCVCGAHFDQFGAHGLACKKAQIENLGTRWSTTSWNEHWLRAASQLSREPNGCKKNNCETYYSQLQKL